MPHIFLDSWKRLDRAIAHGKAFKVECERIINPESYTTVPSMNDDWTWGTLKAITNTIPENDIGLELGEFFYQLRSALDAAVYQVSVMEQGVEPPAHENSVEFPIYQSPEKFNRNPINRAPFPKQLRDWLEVIQPYNTTKTANTGDSTLNGKLQLIHNCARKDRHRRLHVVAAVPTHFDWEFTVEGPGKITFTNPVQGNFLERECIFLEFGMEGVLPTHTTNLKLATAIAIEVAFNEIPVPPGSNVGSELKRLVDAVDYILRVFESGYAHLSPPSP